MGKMQRVGSGIADGGWRLNRYTVYCGRRSCRKCPHGPYWYAQRRMGHHKVRQYVGKTLEAWVEKRRGRVGEKVLRELENERALARGAAIVAGAGAEGSGEDGSSL